MDDCLFCKIVAGEIPAHKIYEDDHFIAFLDIKPINLGHTLIVPKEHSRNLFDMKKEILDKIGSTIQKIARAVKEGAGADGINIGWNNERAAGQLVFHSHIHVMPRFTGDGYEHWHGQNVSTADLAEMAGKIKQAI